VSRCRQGAGKEGHEKRWWRSGGVISTDNDIQAVLVEVTITELTQQKRGAC